MGRKLLGLLRSRIFALVLSIGSTVLVAAGIVYFYFFAPALAAGPAQPIPFSHRLHVSIKEIDCRFCHYGVERGPHAGLPSTTKCLYCHKHIIPEHPKILELKGYDERGEAVPWRKITWLPDHVYFSHQRHIRKNVDCVECHGQIETMDRIKEAHRFKMGFCLECHQKRKASEDCWACHK